MVPEVRQGSSTLTGVPIVPAPMMECSADILLNPACSRRKKSKVEREYEKGCREEKMEGEVVVVRGGCECVAIERQSQTGIS